MRRLSVLLLALCALSLLLLSAAVGLGQEPSEAPEITPTVYVQLPFVARYGTPVPPGAPTPIPPDDLAREQEVADLINQHRRANGLPAVTLVSELTQAARRHSRDMADNDFFSHTGSDGSNAGQRMREAGYDWAAWGEIIAAGYRDAASAVNAWLNSPGHRAIMLSSSYEDFGVGYAVNSSSYYGRYWTVVFGRRALQGSESSEPYVCRFSSQGEPGSISYAFHSQEPCRE
jgi:uncharacterized protein YkwD